MIFRFLHERIYSFVLVSENKFFVFVCSFVHEHLLRIIKPRQSMHWRVRIFPRIIFVFCRNFGLPETLNTRNIFVIDEVRVRS